MNNSIIGVALRDLEAGQVCILGKDIATQGTCKVKIKQDYFEVSEAKNREIKIVVQPNLGSQINWSHPLSRGLVGCFIMDEGEE